MKARAVLLATMTGIIALIVAACGGSEAPATPKPTSVPTSTPPVATSTPSPSPTLPPTVLAAPSPTPTPAAGPTPIVKPGKRGGTLVLHAAQDIAQWDNYDVKNTAEWRWTNLMFNGLVTPDPYNFTTIVGDLAESWTLGRNGTEYLFNLRRASWHDGKPVTAADIVYNLRRAQATNPNPPTVTGLKANVKGMVTAEAVDNRTVKVTLNKPAASFLDRIAVAKVVMFPSHFPFPEQRDAWIAKPTGSGPFKYKEYKKGDRIEWVRNDTYFKEGLPYVDGVVFHVILFAAQSTVIAGWRAGKFMADAGSDGNAITPILDAIEKDLGFVHLITNAGRSELHLNNKAPWNDARVRQALAIGVDRQLIVDTWLRGHGNTMASPVLPVDQGGAWGLPASELLKRPGFPTASNGDSARAKRLLQEAGVNPGVITIQHLDQQAFAQAGAPEAIAAALGKLGFNVRIVLPSDADGTAMKLRGDFDMFHDVRTIQFDDPLDRGGMDSVLTGNPNNYGKWSDPTFDRLADEQEATIDPGARKALVFELQRRYLDDAFAIPLLYRDYDTGYLPYVKNYPKPPFTFAARFRWEQVWLDR